MIEFVLWMDDDALFDVFLESWQPGTLSMQPLHDVQIQTPDTIWCPYMNFRFLRVSIGATPTSHHYFIELYMPSLALRTH